MTDGPRARARAHTTAEIKRIAREHLAQDGPNLSLRAVARDLGVVSSAVYRYFGSRGELLTVLLLGRRGEVARGLNHRRLEGLARPGATRRGKTPAKGPPGGGVARGTRDP